MKKTDVKEIVDVINAMSKRKEELWLSRIVPFAKGKKEQWIISLVNKKRQVKVKDLLRSLKATTRLDKNAEFWICERMKKGKWVCTFYPKAAKKSWRF